MLDWSLRRRCACIWSRLLCTAAFTPTSRLFPGCRSLACIPGFLVSNDLGTFETVKARFQTVKVRLCTFETVKARFFIFGTVKARFWSRLLCTAAFTPTSRLFPGCRSLACV